MGLFTAKPRNDLRGRWSDVFSTLFIVLGFYLVIRWSLFEPFVIPSGSMKPTLLIQDYVMVKKWGYGLRLPLTDQWLIGPATPQRGDIVVFRAKEDDYHFMVKRVVGLAGDKVAVDAQGRVAINGQPFTYEEQKSTADYDRFRESNGRASYTVQFDANKVPGLTFEEVVPEGQIFMMGDNRDHSMDSRFWGSLPVTRILGQVSFVWMSCQDSDKVSSFLCPPESIRSERIFKVIR